MPVGLLRFDGGTGQKTFGVSCGVKINQQPLLLPAAISNSSAHTIRSRLNCRKQQKAGGGKFVASCRAVFLSTLDSLAKLKRRQYGAPRNPMPQQEVANKDLSVISYMGGVIAVSMPHVE